MKLDFIINILSVILLFLIVNNVAAFGQLSQRGSHPLLSSLFRTANEVNGPNAAPIRPVRKPSYSVHDAKRFFDKFSENYHREAATRRAILVPRITSTFHSQRPDTSGTSLLSQSARHELLTNGIRRFHQNLPCRQCNKFTQRRLHMGTMGNTNRHMSAGSPTVAGSIFGGPYFPAQTTGHLSSTIHTNELSPASQAVPPAKPILSNEFHAPSESSRNPQELINQIPSQVLNDMIQSPAADVKQDFSHIYNVLETPSSGSPIRNNHPQDIHFDSSMINIAINNGMVPSSVHNGPMSNSGRKADSFNTYNQIIDSQLRGLNSLGSPINNNVQDFLPIPNGFVPPEINSVTNGGLNEGTVGFNQHQASSTSLLDPTLNFNNGFRQPDVSLQIPSLLPTQQEQTFLDMQQTNEVLPAGMDLIGRGIDLVRSNGNDNTRLLENPSIIPSLGIIGDILQGDISSVNSEGLQGVIHSSSVDGLPIDTMGSSDNFPQPPVNRNEMPRESGIGSITHNSGQLPERFPKQVDMGIDLPLHNQLVADNIISHNQQIQNGFIPGPKPHESINHGSDISQIMPVDGAPGNLEGASYLPELNNGNPSPNQNMPHADNTMIDTLAAENAPIDISHDAPDGFLNVGFIPENNIVEQPNAIPVNKEGMPVTDAHVDAAPIYFDSPLNTDGGVVDLNSDINNIIDHQQAVQMKEMSNQNQQVDVVTGIEQGQVIEPTTSMQHHDGIVMTNVESPDMTIALIEPGVPVTDIVSDDQIDTPLIPNNQVAVDQNQPGFQGETIQEHPLPELIPQVEHLGISVPTEPAFDNNFNPNSVSSDNVLDFVVPKLMNNVNGIRHVELITNGGVPVDGQAVQAQNKVDIVDDISQDKIHHDNTHNSGDGFIDAIPEGHANIQNNKPVHAKEISHPHILVDSNAESTMIPDPQSELPTNVDIVKFVDSSNPQHSSESGGIPIHLSNEVPIGIDNAVSNPEQPGHIEIQPTDPVVIVKTVPVAETPAIFQRQNEEMGITERNTETHNAVTDDINGIQNSPDILPPIFVPVLNDNADSIIVPKLDLQSEQPNLQPGQTVGADVMTKGDIRVDSDASILNAKDIGQGLIDNPAIDNIPVIDPQQEIIVPVVATGETAHDQTLHLLDLLSGGIDPHIDHSNHGLDQHPVIVDDNFKPTISPDVFVKPIVASAETTHISDIDVGSPELSGVPVTIPDIAVKPDVTNLAMEQTDLHNMLSQPDHHSNINSISLSPMEDITGDHIGIPKVETIPGQEHLPTVTTSNVEIHQDGTGHRDVLLKLEDLMMGITDSSNHGHPNLNKEIKPTVDSSMPGEHNHEPKGKHAYETGNDPILLFTTDVNADNTGLNHGDVLLKLNNLMMGITGSSAINPNHEHHAHSKEHTPMVSSSKSEKQTDNAKNKHAHIAGEDNIFQTEPNAGHNGSTHGDVLLSIEDLIPGFVESNIASSTHGHSTNKVNKPGNKIAVDQSVDEVTSGPSPKPQKPKQHPLVTPKEKQQARGPSKATTFQKVPQAANPDIFVKIKGEPIRFDQFFNIPSGLSSNSNGMVPTDVLRQLVNAELSISSTPIVSTDNNNIEVGKKANADVPIVKAKNAVVAESNTHNVHSDHVIVNINRKEMTPAVIVTEKLPQKQEIKPRLHNIVPGIIATSIDTENLGLGGEMADNALHSHTGVITGNEIITDDISILDVTMDKAHKEAHIREGDKANHQHLHDNLKTPFDPVRH